MMRESYPHIKHEYDLWQIAKGLKKKLIASKNQELTPWVRSIRNHLWYAAATCDSNAKRQKEKWMSILHHITDEHQWVSGEYITQCEHDPYTPEEACCRPWLQKESKGFQILRNAVLDKKLLKDLEKVKCHKY